MRPTIRQLEYVVAVAEEASFSRAAARCFVSQPSLSTQVKQLEMQLGTTLFERTPKGVLLTPVGRDVLALAREVLSASDRIVTRAAAPRRPLAGPLELGCVSTVTPYLVPAAMAELRTRFPDLDLHIRDGVGDVLEAELAAGSLDALIVPLPTGLPGCEEVGLARDAFVLVAPARSELGRLPEPIDPEVLAGHEILLLEDPHCLRRHALEVCAAARAVPHATLHATSLGTIVQLVRRGFGATLLPEIAIPVELSGVSEVSLKRFTDPAPGRTLGLAWRKGSHHADGLRELASILMRYCPADVS
jgi:LysR family hydrogen peroxide-inducible transcriptional activator